MDMQNVSNLQIPEGVVRTIHDKYSRLIWGRLNYDTKYAGDTLQNGTPTPDSPIPIQTVVGEQTVTISDGVSPQSYKINLGKNLFNTTNYSGNVTITGLNSFEANRDTARTANMYFSPRLPAGTYTLSYDVSKNSLNTEGIKCSVYVVNGGGTSILGTIPQFDGHVEYTFTSTTEVDRLYFFINSSMPSGSTASVSNIQVEVGASATSFAPYFTPIELCKIGDDQDYIYKSSDDWYVHKVIGKISSYNGETITTDYISNTGSLTNGAIVYYVLATATDTQITDATLIGQLNAVHEWLTRYGYNATVTGNLPIIVDRTNL